MRMQSRAEPLRSSCGAMTSRNLCQAFLSGPADRGAASATSDSFLQLSVKGDKIGGFGCEACEFFMCDVCCQQGAEICRGCPLMFCFGISHNHQILEAYRFAFGLFGVWQCHWLEFLPDGPIDQEGILPLKPITRKVRAGAVGLRRPWPRCWFRASCLGWPETSMLRQWGHFELVYNSTAKCRTHTYTRQEECFLSSGGTKGIGILEQLCTSVAVSPGSI